MDQRIADENQHIANLTNEQQQKLSNMEKELGCVLVAYQTKNQAHNSTVK